jgi:RHS repeat-associated protein
VAQTQAPQFNWTKNAYDSFGNLVASTGSLVNSFRYTGREFDTETSLYYYRARYYDPTTGRFFTEDPVGFRGRDIDLYRYAGNDPILLIDPTGLIKLYPPDKTENTVVCAGGGMKVQIGLPRKTPLQEKCTEDCIRVHEESHIADDMAANPNICKGQADGVRVGFSNPDEQKAGEIKAYTRELGCLRNKMSHRFCKDCFQAIQDAIQNAEDRILAFKNGKN